jgi:hypothetical protein
MTRWPLFAVSAALVFGLSGCDQLVESLSDSTPPPAPPEVVEDSEQTPPEVAQATFSASCQVEPADPTDLLQESRRSGRALDAGSLEATMLEWALPVPTGERINTLDEVCPGWLIASSNSGQIFLVDTDTLGVIERGTLARSGTIERISSRGIESGGPQYGVKDLVVSGEDIFYSVAVVDEAQSCLRLEVRKVKTEDLWLSGEEPPSTLLYSSEPCVDFTADYREKAPLKIHLGGALAFDPLTDTLYLTVGDFHMGASRIQQAVSAGIDNTEADYRLLQDPNAALSAVVAITPTSASSTGEVISKGLRNPLGIVQDSEGRVWASEMGPGGGDEINLITRGADYGWPLTSPGQPYDRSQWPESADDLPASFLDFHNKDIPGTTPPVRFWTPAIAPSALAFLPDGSVGFPGFSGMLVMATLRDQAIHFVDISSPGAPTAARVAVDRRLRDLIVDSRGHIWAVTDEDTLLQVSGR